MYLYPFDGELDDRSHFHFNEHRTCTNITSKDGVYAIPSTMMLFCSCAVNNRQTALQQSKETNPKRHGLHGSAFWSAPLALPCKHAQVS